MAGELDEGTGGVEGSGATGVHVRVVVVVEHPDKVSTLQLGSEVKGEGGGGLMHVDPFKNKVESIKSNVVVFSSLDLHLHFSQPVCTSSLCQEKQARRSENRQKQGKE